MYHMSLCHPFFCFHSIAIIPNCPNSFVSSGEDRCVKVWKGNTSSFWSGCKQYFGVTFESCQILSDVILVVTVKHYDVDEIE